LHKKRFETKTNQRARIFFGLFSRICLSVTFEFLRRFSLNNSNLHNFQGCNEHHDLFPKYYRPWTAYRSDDYGYTRMTIHNKTHLYMEQVSVDKVSEEGRDGVSGIVREIFATEVCKAYFRREIFLEC